MCANILGEKSISLESKRFIEILVTKGDISMMGLRITADLFFFLIQHLFIFFLILFLNFT